MKETVLRGKQNKTTEEEKLNKIVTTAGSGHSRELEGAVSQNSRSGNEKKKLKSIKKMDLGEV